MSCTLPLTPCQPCFISPKLRGGECGTLPRFPESRFPGTPVREYTTHSVAASPSAPGPVADPCPDVSTTSSPSSVVTIDDERSSSLSTVASGCASCSRSTVSRRCRMGSGRPAEETDHPQEVVEAALAHVVQNKIEAAYRRMDLFEWRRRLMDDWAAYLAGER